MIGILFFGIIIGYMFLVKLAVIKVYEYLSHFIIIYKTDYVINFYFNRFKRGKLIVLNILYTIML